MQAQKQAQADLWALGLVSPYYLYDYQKPVYSFVRETRNPFFEATRRFGKTTTVLVKQCEDCQMDDMRVVIWCEPWKEQARNIVIPEMDKVCSIADGGTRPKFYRTDSFYEFPKTGSRIYLVGVNEDRAEGARGRTAHEIVADEKGSWVDAEYIENEVLRPLLLTTGGQVISMGTPPHDLGHYWYTDKANAIAEDRYIGRDFDSIQSISERAKAEFIESMGGRKSTAVRRELYLEPVADSESLVLPEFKEELHVKEWERPQFFDTYVGADFGFNDCTAFLFGYYDFLKTTLVIENEVLLRGKNTKEIVDACKIVEQDLWQGNHKPTRVGDNELQQLYDMQNLHDYYVSPTAKDDKLAAVNNLRLRFQSNRIVIHPRCKNLIYQCKVGMWNDRRTGFLRGEKTGHLDAIDALIYLNRNVSESRNPYPHNLGLDVMTHFALPHQPSKRKENDLASVFEPFGEVNG